MPSKEQNLFSKLSEIKRCELHGIWYIGICDLCDNEISNTKNVMEVQKCQKQDV
jgi:hypothetical protein